MKGPQPKDGYIRKLRRSDSKDVEEIKGKDIDSTGQTAVTEVKEKTEKEILQKRKRLTKKFRKLLNLLIPQSQSFLRFTMLMHLKQKLSKCVMNWRQY